MGDTLLRREFLKSFALVAVNPFSFPVAADPQKVMLDRVATYTLLLLCGKVLGLLELPPGYPQGTGPALGLHAGAAF